MLKKENKKNWLSDGLNGERMFVKKCRVCKSKFNGHQKRWVCNECADNNNKPV